MFNTGAFKRFTISVLKVACGIVVAAFIIGLVVWAVVAFRENSEEVANAPLATLKTWPEVTVGALTNAKVHLQTVWRSCNIYYKFDVQGYPPAFRQIREPLTPWRPTAQAVFIITFLDKDGFRLFEHTTPVTEMAAAVGADGQPTGLSWKGDEFMDVGLYRRATRAC